MITEVWHSSWIWIGWILMPPPPAKSCKPLKNCNRNAFAWEHTEHLFLVELFSILFLNEVWASPDPLWLWHKHILPCLSFILPTHTETRRPRQFSPEQIDVSDWSFTDGGTQVATNRVHIWSQFIYMFVLRVSRCFFKGIPFCVLYF